MEDLGAQEKNRREDLNSFKTDSNILSLRDLYNILPFGKSKINKLVKTGQLPLVKVGRDYITTYSILEKWISDNIGQEIYY